jgi:hypothetical protein
MSEPAPLTDERINELYRASFEPMPRRKNSYISNPIKFARAIEREVLGAQSVLQKHRS